MAAAWVHLSEVEPWLENPRFIPNTAIEVVASLILEHGWTTASTVHVGEGDAWPVRLVAGHTRRLALLKILEKNPAHVIPGAPGPGYFPARPHVVADLELPAEPGQVTPAARYATWAESSDAAIGDNAGAEYSSWDHDALAAIIRRQAGELPVADVIAQIKRRTGLEQQVVRDLLRRGRAPRLRTEIGDQGFRAPPVTPESKPGELYELGPHRLVCGDSRDRHHVEALLAGDPEPPIMLSVDPPYGAGKEAEGVLNDNQNAEELDTFNAAWWKTWRDRSAHNVSVYVWGFELILWRFWLLAEVENDDGRMVRGLGQSNVTFRNLIIWRKPNAIGVNSPDMRQYPPTTERALFFMRGRQALGNTNKDDFWSGFEPLRAWQAEQFARMGWGMDDVKRICGVGMYTHWTSASQWCVIPAVHYEALANEAAGKAFARPHRELREEYHALLDHPELVGARQAFYATRSPFDNTHAPMTDVWDFPRVQGEDRFGHATPKPVELAERQVLSSSEIGQVVAVPFGGTAPDLIACARQGRVARVMELSPRWCDVIRDRWTRWAMAAGEDPGPGALVIKGAT